MVSEMCTHVIFRQIVIEIWEEFNKKQQEKEQILKGRYINMKFSQIWKKRAVRWSGDEGGSNYDDIYQYRVRRLFTVFGVST